MVSAAFELLGRLFHMTEPEYDMLCLKISLFGFGGMKLFEMLDLKAGKFSL